MHRKEKRQSERQRQAAEQDPTWVERVLGPASAKEMVPAVLDPMTGSSLIELCSHSLLSAASPEIPNYQCEEIGQFGQGGADCVREGGAVQGSDSTQSKHRT